MSQKRWSKPASTRANGLKLDFMRSLRGIAEHLAVFDEADTVSIAHVNRAHSMLCESGINRTHWLKRPSTEQAFGAFLLGLTASCPDVVTTLVDRDYATYAPVIAKTVMGSFFVFGIICCCHGYFRGRLVDAAPRKKSLLAIALAVGLAIAGLYFSYAIYQRVVNNCCAGGSAEAVTLPAPLAPTE